MYISSEYIFSDWIFIWFIIYILVHEIFQNKTIIYRYFNPKIALYLAFLQNIFTILYFLLEKDLFWVNGMIFIKYLLMMVTLKIIPLFIIYSHPIYKTNIFIAIGIFIIYLGFLYYKKTNLVEIYTKIKESILLDDNNTPFFYMLHKLFGI